MYIFKIFPIFLTVLAAPLKCYQKNAGQSRVIDKQGDCQLLYSKQYIQTYQKVKDIVFIVCATWQVKTDKDIVFIPRATWHVETVKNIVFIPRQRDMQKRLWTLYLCMYYLQLDMSKRLRHCI